MKYGNRLQHAASFPRLAITAALTFSASEAFARAPNAVPEPSLLTLIGAGAVAGIIIYRIKNKK